MSWWKRLAIDGTLPAMCEARDTLTVIHHVCNVDQHKPMKDAKDRNLSHILS